MEDLKIIQKTYDMIEYGYSAIAQFPKSEKYALGNDMSTFLTNTIKRKEQLQAYVKTLKDITIINAVTWDTVIPTATA